MIDLLRIGAGVALAVPYILSMELGLEAANAATRRFDDPAKRLAVWVACMVVSVLPVTVAYLALLGLYALLTGAV